MNSQAALSLESRNIRINVTIDGILVLSDESGHSLQCVLLPTDRSTSQPYPYNKLVSHDIDLGRSESIHWALKEDNGAIRITRQQGQWRFWQDIRVEDSVCIIETYALIPESLELPSCINVLELPEQDFWSDAAMLAPGDSMGTLSIRRTGEFEDGDLARSVFAVQKSDMALLISSDMDTPQPLRMAMFDRSWHIMGSSTPSVGDDIVSLGRVELRLGESAQDMLEDFASRTSGGKIFKKSPKCWNSWDFYHLSISEEKILENVRAIAADDILRNEIECIVVDMGWEVRFGEWVADPNFPNGMGHLADRIREQGFRAGLWLAPVIVDPECNMLLDDYDFVAHNSYGFPDRTYECCGLFGYILDVTRPEGEDYLRNLFRGYREMGYTYFKLDFLRFLMYADHFHDRSLTHVEVMRKALGIIREGVGEDSYILACNLPFEVGPGYCDASRVSNDVAVFWDNVKANARDICCSYFLNDRWWRNDPDFLVVRGRDTYESSEPIYRTWWFPRQDEFGPVEELYRKMHDMSSTLSIEEARTHASLELMLGGAIVLGDPVMYLKENGLELIRRVITADSSPGRPIDLFDGGGLVSVWMQELNDRVRIGLFNWDDSPKTISFYALKSGLRLRKDTAIDFWTGEQVQLRDGEFMCELAPHSCRVVEAAL